MEAYNTLLLSMPRRGFLSAKLYNSAWQHLSARRPLKGIKQGQHSHFGQPLKLGGRVVLRLLYLQCCTYKLQARVVRQIKNLVDLQVVQPGPAASARLA